jgi:hypothetical protein
MGIGFYFLLMELLGLAIFTYYVYLMSHLYFFGTYKTLKSNFAEGKKITSLKRCFSITYRSHGYILKHLGLIVYSYVQGGDAYVGTLSKHFIWWRSIRNDVFYFSVI